jgi:hypothetical protein
MQIKRRHGQFDVALFVCRDLERPVAISGIDGIYFQCGGPGNNGPVRQIIAAVQPDLPLPWHSEFRYALWYGRCFHRSVSSLRRRRYPALNQDDFLACLQFLSARSRLSAWGPLAWQVRHNTA